MRIEAIRIKKPKKFITKTILLAIIGSAAGFFLYQSSPVLANHICGGISVFCGDKDQAVRLSVTANGVPKGDGDVITAGDNIEVTMSYGPLNNTASGGIISWIKFDSDDAQFNGLSYNTPGGGFRLGAIGGGDPGGCPSFFFDNESPYHNAAVGPLEGDNYPPPPWSPWWGGWGADLADGNGYMTCGSEGQAAIWYSAQNSHNNTGTYSAHFRVNPESQNAKNICIRGYVSKDFASRLIGRSPQDICLHMTPIRISGSLQSDPTNATGKGLGSVGLAFSRSCTGTYRDIGTDAAGNWELEPGNNATRYQTVCMRLPVNTSSGGTSYTVIGGHAGSWYDGGYYYVPVQCGNVPGCEYQFYYNPTPQNPAMAKSVNVGTADLKPGDTVEYTVTANNPYDSNSPSAVIEDNIPLNIDPNSVVVTSLSSTTTAGAPNIAGLPWVADGGLPCSPGALAYGFQAPSGWRTKSTATNCSILDNPRRISIAMDRMPAYSQISFTWRGTVKGVNDIGFDRNGLQGVYNVATGGVNGNLPSPSLAVYNPIPGDIICVAKSAFIESTDATGSSSTICETQVQNEYLYDPSPTEPKYNEAIIKLYVNPDETKGPVNYYLRDPSSGQLNPKISDVTTGDCTPDNNGVCGPRTVSWGSTASLNNHQRWPYVYNPSVATTTNDYDFRAKLRNDPSAPEGVGVNAVGQTFTNQASACIIQTWKDSWPVDCRPSNAITFKLIDVRRPFVTSEQGDIYSGGNSGRSTCSIDSATPSPIVNGIRNNPGGQGWYMVTAPGGTISGFDSLAGYNGSAPVCRPDIGKALDNLISKNPGIRITTASSSYAPGTSDTANTGKVLEISGDFTIGDSDTAAELVEISRRWTIYVNGNLNIRDNIQYQDGTNPLTAAGSLGVVATGDINIAPWVTRLDGAYYAKGKINTCATAGPFKTLSYRVGTTTYPGYTPTECGQQLTINGVVLANSFRYNRTAQQAVGSYGEIAKLTDRLFLATPPGFSDLALQFNPAIYQGERRPRY